MKALANLDRNATTAAGIAGGLTSWILANVKLLTEVVSLVGTVCGASVALLSLLLKIREWRRRRAEPPFREPDYFDDIP